MQRDWTALETLAEVSRQIDMSEKHDDGPPGGGGAAAGTSAAAAPASASAAEDQHSRDSLELQEQFTLENPPSAQKSSPQGDRRGAQQSASEVAGADLSDQATEDRIKALLETPGSATAASFAVAVAATARLNTSLLDPQLRPEEAPAAPMDIAEPSVAPEGPSPPPPPVQPWGEITYIVETPSTAANNSSPGSYNRSQFRIDSPYSAKRHSRARFDATRRKEVQEVRKIGACIRCRILRKTCSKGSPCDACRKVLAPRIWRSGCVRTKFTEQLDIFSAGVQIVLAQNRTNNLKAAIQLEARGLSVVASHFPEKDFVIEAKVVQSRGVKAVIAGTETTGVAQGEAVMLDIATEDLPAKVEAYMRSATGEFIEREPSHFVRVTLDTAVRVAEQTNDMLLKRAVELWALVEILDRERQWDIVTKPTARGAEARPIKADADEQVYTTLCLQLTAAAERKAAATSKLLLTGMQRILQDSKTRVDFPMFLTTLVLLSATEKITWAFKAWEQESLKVMWPLEKQPGSFTEQGFEIASLLRMLLDIRKATPQMSCRESDGILVTKESDPGIRGYFEALNLSGKNPSPGSRSLLKAKCAVADIQAKQQEPVFSPTDSRSCELLFCASLLLPGQE